MLTNDVVSFEQLGPYVLGILGNLSLVALARERSKLYTYLFSKHIELLNNCNIYLF